MKHWTVDRPTTLDFDGVAALRVRVVQTDNVDRLDRTLNGRTRTNG